MAYVISDSCISCGTCEGECPVNAISAGDSQYVINADLTDEELNRLVECDLYGLDIDEIRRKEAEND